MVWSPSVFYLSFFFREWQDFDVFVEALLSLWTHQGPFTFELKFALCVSIDTEQWWIENAFLHYSIIRCRKRLKRIIGVNRWRFTFSCSVAKDLFLLFLKNYILIIFLVIRNKIVTPLLFAWASTSTGNQTFITFPTKTLKLVTLLYFLSQTVKYMSESATCQVSLPMHTGACTHIKPLHWYVVVMVTDYDHVGWVRGAWRDQVVSKRDSEHPPAHRALPPRGIHARTRPPPLPPHPYGTFPNIQVRNMQFDI